MKIWNNVFLLITFFSTASFARSIEYKKCLVLQLEALHDGILPSNYVELLCADSGDRSVKALLRTADQQLLFATALSTKRTVSVTVDVDSSAERGYRTQISSIKLSR